PKEVVAVRRVHAASKLFAAVAHYVVVSLSDLSGVIALFNARLAQVERP
ncbi:phosphonoacetaldehyde hydrolase, partial [Salmonella enterica subsp. enterica serovar Enteritidis]